MDLETWANNELDKIDYLLDSFPTPPSPNNGFKPPTPPPIPGVDIGNLPDLSKLQALTDAKRVIGTPPTPSQIPNSIYNIIMGSQQKNLPDAILADIIDIIPIVGDVANVGRVVDASASSKSKKKNKTIITQSIDMAAGSLPDPIGTILDILTPTNTVNYLGIGVADLKTPTMDVSMPSGKELRMFIEREAGIELPLMPDELLESKVVAMQRDFEGKIADFEREIKSIIGGF